MKYLYFLIPIIVAFFTWEKDYWWSKIAILIAMASVALAFEIAKKFHWSLFAPIVSTLLSSIWITNWRPNQYHGLHVWTRLNLREGAHMSTFTFLILVMFISLVKAKDLLVMLWGISFVGTMNASYVIYQALSGVPTARRGGFFDYPGMNASYIAICLPLIFITVTRLPVQITLASISVVAIFLSGSSIPIGVLAVAISVFLFARLKRKWISAVAFLLPMIPGYFLIKNFLSDADRFRHWEYYWNWFLDSKYSTVMFGSGNGTFIHLGPSIQRSVHDPSLGVGDGRIRGLLIWAHNDWLQLLFEQGVVGVLAFGTMFFCAGLKLYQGRQFGLLSCFMAWLACAFFNYPTHLAAHSLIMLVVIAIAFKSRFRHTEHLV